MNHFEQFKAMLNSQEALKDQFQFVTAVAVIEEPSSFIALDSGESDGQSILFSFDTNGNLWNIHIQPGKVDFANGSTWQSVKGKPVLVSRSTFSVEN